jgi:hypothetical protein
MIFSPSYSSDHWFQYCGSKVEIVVIFFISWQIILLIIYVMNYSSVFYGLSWLCDLTELDLCLPIFCTSFYFVLIYIGCCNSLRFHTFCLKKKIIFVSCVDDIQFIFFCISSFSYKSKGSSTLKKIIHCLFIVFILFGINFIEILFYTFKCFLSKN